MRKLEELQDKAENLRVWLSFWLNVVLAIFVGFATVIFAYAIDTLTDTTATVLCITLLTFLSLVAKIIISIWKNQSNVSTKIGKE